MRCEEKEGITAEVAEENRENGEEEAGMKASATGKKEERNRKRRSGERRFCFGVMRRCRGATSLWRETFCACESSAL